MSLKIILSLRNKDPKEIHILDFGARNNFFKLYEAFFKKALKDYGNLCKLVKQDTEDCIWQL